MLTQQDLEIEPPLSNTIPVLARPSGGRRDRAQQVAKDKISEMGRKVHAHPLLGV